MFWFCVFRFFNGDYGAFTLLEATPEFLKISQIDENGNEVNKAQLKPRGASSRTDDATFGFNNPWGSLIAVLLALVGTLGAISFARALRSKKSRKKILWARVPEEANEDSETENLTS